ncbi:class I SAM-dependent methyltransferase [Jiangella asiatica]|uniref:Class I SAM-dependent methyltransferase n=1 Tax=Jiangella asiatica TaxID=2530372 RepID=A0A4R5CDZ7_9ACTN|nr:class I SAM-dependent methyltransferase [Jiangella asiatica]TDD95394.1 class I SAM-dependent methyltransferase [Jiangella asiatica]
MPAEPGRVAEGYADARFAELYDAENPWSRSDDFYQALDLRAGSVLDVGCGTGRRLISTRERGHDGELTGVDPAPGMLSVARRGSDRVRWVLADAVTMRLDSRVELVTMTGHAFQELLDDDAVRAALATFRRHLEPGGLLAFETRNPAARDWEGWRAQRTRQVVANPAGERFETWVDAPEPHGDLVTFQSCILDLGSGDLHAESSTLRFVDPGRLRELVEAAGFVVEGWFGDWDRGPVTPTSAEVIVLARQD